MPSTRSFHPSPMRFSRSLCCWHSTSSFGKGHHASPSPPRTLTHLYYGNDGVHYLRTRDDGDSDGDAGTSVLVRKSGERMGPTLSTPHPPWLTVYEFEFLAGYYEGESSIYWAEHLRIWIRPRCSGQALSSCSTAPCSVWGFLPRKQWMEREKLSFPAHTIAVANDNESEFFPFPVPSGSDSESPRSCV